MVSDLPLAEVTRQLNAAFGDWTAPSTPKGTKTFGAAAPAQTGRIILINRPQSPQSLIYGGSVLGLSGTDDLLTLNTANTILGADFPAVQGFIILVTTIYILIYLAVDIITAILDPRVEL